MSIDFVKISVMEEKILPLLFEIKGEDSTYQTGVFNDNAILRGNAIIK